MARRDGLVVEYGEDTLPRYDVSFSPGSPGAARLEAVTNARLFDTKHRRSHPQFKLFALEEALGEGGWLKALALEGYMTPCRGKFEALQGALFPYLAAT